MTTAQALFGQGLALHQAGRLEEATGWYERALGAEPDHFDALHMLGVACLQTGKFDQGAALLERAVKAGPDQAAAHLNLGAALTALKRFDLAVASCERAVALAPSSVEAHANFGNALRALGRFEAALASYDQALALSPASAVNHYNRGNALRDLGRLAPAQAAYERAVALKPDFLEAHVNLGGVFERLDRLNEAVAAFDAAIAARPGSPEAHSNRAKALNDLKRSEEALASAEWAIGLRPEYAEAHNNLALALYDLRRLDEALTAANKAIALKPDYAEAHNNRGIVLFDQRRLDEALASYDHALSLRADFPEAHLNRATSLLSLGELKPGFEEYRWRWKTRGFRPLAPRLDWPAWVGEDLAGKSILLHGEQGFGDHLQFVRYAPLVAARAGRVTLLTEPPLARLFRSIPGIEVADRLADDAAFDFHAPLMDLPRLFGTTLATVPAATPHLAADPKQVADWRDRLAGYVGLRVGLVWAGDTHKGRPAGAAVDRRRSLRLDQFAPLGGIEGVTLFSLQKGDPAVQALSPPAGLKLIDFTSDLHDFADTAALVTNLDLVIAVDTAVAHLAGALANPVWILSRYEGDWRWLNGREDSPWYPSAKLFHQRASGEWDDVIGRVTKALARFRPGRA